MICFLFAVHALALTAQAAPVPPVEPPASVQTQALDRTLNRIYDWDLTTAHGLLGDYTKQYPDDPLGWSVTAGAWLFGEFDRLHILEMDFFADDDAIVDKRTLRADPGARTRIFDALDHARARAGARLALDGADRDALLAMCMASNTVADYTAFVERKQWRGAMLERQAVVYTNRLLALAPPAYDAYYTAGTLEYIVGSLPFFIRWFVHYEGVSGSKARGVEQLELVAKRGRYYGPFARVLLTLVALREKRLEEAERRIADLAREFPENGVFRKELARIQAELRRTAKKR